MTCKKLALGHQKAEAPEGAVPNGCEFDVFRFKYQGESKCKDLQVSF